MFGKKKLVWRLVVIFMATIIPLIMLLLTNSFYSINRSNELLAESNHGTVVRWTAQIDGSLHMLERSLASVAYIESDFSVLGHSEKELNVRLASNAISQRLSTMMNAFSVAGGLFLYSPADNAWADSFRDSQYSFSFRQSVRDFVKGLNKETLPKGKWTVLTVDEKSMLFYALYREDVRLVAMVDFDLLVGAAQESYSLFYTDLEGNLLSGGAFSGAGKHFGDQSDGRTYVYGEDQDAYLTVWTTSECADIRVALALSHAGYWDGLTWVQNVLLILSLLSLLLIPFVYYITKKNLSRPLEKMTDSMNRIRNGELQTQITEDFYFDELEDVKTTFNAMMSEVHSLKIEVYEQELERQRVELQYRQGQLRPHFFLNCLKNIHALAQRGKTDEIQEMVLATSDYLRYLFRDNQKTVSLREELTYVRDYIRIQCLSRVKAPVYEVVMDEALNDVMIPPLSVETFVENAIKHHGVPDRAPVIHVKIVLLDSEEERYIDVTVRDNGGGFSADQLEQLNSMTGEQFESEHVGLGNLNRRLKLLYGDSAALAFYNEGDGGVSEMICPIRMGEDAQ